MHLQHCWDWIPMGTESSQIQTSPAAAAADEDAEVPKEVNEAKGQKEQDLNEEMVLPVNTVVVGDQNQLKWSNTPCSLTQMETVNLTQLSFLSLPKLAPEVTATVKAEVTAASVRLAPVASVDSN